MLHCHISVAHCFISVSKQFHCLHLYLSLIPQLKVIQLLPRLFHCNVLKLHGDFATEDSNHIFILQSKFVWLPGTAGHSFLPESLCLSSMILKNLDSPSVSLFTISHVDISLFNIIFQSQTFFYFSSIFFVPGKCVNDQSMSTIIPGNHASPLEYPGAGCLRSSSNSVYL